MSVTKKLLIAGICITSLLIVLSLLFGLRFVSQQLNSAVDDTLIEEPVHQEITEEAEEAEVTLEQRVQIMSELESKTSPEVGLEPDEFGNIPKTVEVEVDDSSIQAIMDDLEASNEQEVVVEDDTQDAGTSQTTSGSSSQEDESGGEMSREEMEAIMADLESNQGQEVEPDAE